MNGQDVLRVLLFKDANQVGLFCEQRFEFLVDPCRDRHISGKAVPRFSGRLSPRSKNLRDFRVFRGEYLNCAALAQIEALNLIVT